MRAVASTPIYSGNNEAAHRVSVEHALLRRATVEGPNTFAGNQYGPFFDNGGAVFNALANGAVGDGTTDDTAAIQALYDRIVTLGGGTLLLPGHGYSYSVGDVVMHSSGVQIVGTGAGLSTIYGDTGTLIRVQAGSYGFIIGEAENDVESDFALRHMTIIGNSTAKAGIRIGAVLTDPNNQLTRVTLEDIRVLDFTNDSIVHQVATGDAAAPVGACGIFVTRGVNADLIKVICKGNYRGLVECSEGLATTFNHYGCNYRESTVNGVMLRTAKCWLFMGTTFESNGETGLLVQPAENEGARNPRLVQCYVENNCITSGDAEITFDALATGSSIHNVGINGLDVNPWDTNVGVDVLGNAFVYCEGVESNTPANFHVRSDDNAFVVVKSPPRDYSRTLGGYSLGRNSQLDCPALRVGEVLASGDTDDFDCGPENSVQLEGNADGTSALTGLDCTTRKQFRFINVGAFDITIKDQDAGSAAENRFLIPGGADVVLGQDDVIEGFYDGSTERWRVINVQA
jgi:hypothetical protein